VHYVTKHLQQGIESDHFRVKRPMPWVGCFQSFHTARRTIQGFEAMLWLRKGFGFAGTWTVCEQNRLLAFCFGLPQVNKAFFFSIRPVGVKRVQTVRSPWLQLSRGLSLLSGVGPAAPP
jgi:hypothetical protein